MRAVPPVRPPASAKLIVGRTRSGVGKGRPWRRPQPRQLRL